MAAWLAQPLVALAWCWRIERRDGVMIGLTTHDAALEIGGVTYSPSPSMRPSAIHQRAGLDGASFEIEGAIDSSAMAESDLSQGRWDGAALTLLVADWQNPSENNVVIATGRIGAISREGTSFTAELSGRDAALDVPFIPETSPECRAELGDARCRVDMAARVHRAKVVSVDSSGILFDRTWGDGDLTYGRLRWLSGDMRGLSAVIIEQVGARVRIVGASGAAITAGMTAELTDGCDKRAATCGLRFANITNFRGEPHLPGLDLLTRFPSG
ncbi:MAG: DUF2163 domain-containing protein [Sphingopyxis sp.]